MENRQAFSVFTELSLSEQASISGGKSVSSCSSSNGGNGGNANANGGVGGNGGIAIAGTGQPGKSSINCKSGKLSEADKKVLRQTLAGVSHLLSDLL